MNPRPFLFALLCFCGACVSGADLKVTPTQAKGIHVYAKLAESERKTPLAKLTVLITRKTQEAARPTNFGVSVKDASGKELVKIMAKDQKGRLTHREGARWNGIIELPLEPLPAWPVTLVVIDPQEKRPLEFEVKPSEPK